jgi:hypothetical protein
MDMRRADRQIQSVCLTRLPATTSAPRRTAALNVAEQRPQHDRKLLTFFSAVSLLLCVAVCGLWAAYWKQKGFAFFWGNSRAGVAEREGRIPVTNKW